MKTPFLRRLVACGCLALFSLVARAQTPATGTVTGRVFNPATQEYVRNAEVRLEGTVQSTVTESDGSFEFRQVTPGEAAVTINYTGYQAVTDKFMVTAGQTTAREIRMFSTIAPAAGLGDTVQLSAFVVSSDREGNAKAIMDQRRNMNITTSVASDIFGDVTDGNVGEFLKFLPGVDLDYVESETRGPRLGGMDAQYVGVSFDGVKLASADANRTGDLGRATSFEAFSISSIESIEISYTTSPDMDANSPAGTINMKTRRAFDRKGRRITYNTGLNFNSEEFHLQRNYGPGDRPTYKARPNYTFEFSDVFFGQRLGVVASYSHANSYTEQYRESITYNRNPTAADPRPMVITAIDFKDGPKSILKDTYTLTADWKATSRLVLSTAVIYNYALGEFYNRNLTFNAAANNANGNTGRARALGDLTTVTTNGLVANTSRNVALGGSNAAKETNTITVAPKFEYKLGSWTVEGAAAYSRSFNNYEGLEKGFARSVLANNVSSDWTATRPDSSSSNWTITQNSGADWFNLDSFTNPRLTNEGRMARTEIYNADLSARWVTPLRRFPTVLKFGGKWNEENRRNGNDTAYLTWTYIGPGGNTLTGYNATTGLPTFGTTGSWSFVPTRFVFDTGTMNLVNVANIAGQPGMIGRGDSADVAGLFAAHPEYFINNATADNYTTAYITNARDLRQTITAGYGMADVKVSAKLSLRGGLRWEHTESIVSEFDPLIAAQVAAAGYPINTSRRPTSIAGVQYQYFSQPRIKRPTDYDRYFPSIMGKYSFARNLQFQAGFNQAMSRPPVDDLNGVWSINDTTFVITAPNPALKPEKTNSYNARVAYYFEPAGEFSIGLKQTDVTNLRQDLRISAEDFGYGDDPEYASYEFQTTVNSAEERRFRSLELAYRQSLSFLGEKLRGTTVNLGYTRAYSDARRPNLAPHRVSANIGYRYKKFGTRLGAIWHDDIPWSSIDGRYKRHSSMFDWSAEYQVHRYATVFFQARNIFNRPVLWFERADAGVGGGVLQALENYGANWVFGIKGTF